MSVIFRKTTCKHKPWRYRSRSNPPGRRLKPIEQVRVAPKRPLPLRPQGTGPADALPSHGSGLAEAPLPLERSMKSARTKNKIGGGEAQHGSRRPRREGPSFFLGREPPAVAGLFLCEKTVFLSCNSFATRHCF